MEYIPPDKINQNNEENNIIKSNNSSSSRKSSAVELQEKIANLQHSLKSKSKNVCCPYCLKQDLTKTEKDCSFVLTVICIFGGFFIPTLVQFCRGKDMNCDDTNHYCTQCGNKLASYKSC